MAYRSTSPWRVIFPPSWSAADHQLYTPRFSSQAQASRILMAVVGGWTLIGAGAVAVSFVANIALYGYWGFPLDATPIFFLLSSPSAAMASVEWWQGLLGIISMAAVMALILWLFHLLWRRWGKDVFTMKAGKWQWLPMLIVTALLFLPIRRWHNGIDDEHGKSLFLFHPRTEPCSCQPAFLLYGKRRAQ